jgi:predicted esterase
MSGERRHEREIAALVHGRYLLEIPPEPVGSPLLVGFHGYGESAEKSLDEMRRIPGASRWVLCAVQALHPFYNRTGAVIASWMTSQQRERAIVDNIRYVSSVVTEVKRELPASERLVYLGFSQGAAMAYRAAAWSGRPCLGLAAIGGDMPPEVAADASIAWGEVLLTRGEGDLFFTAEKMERDLEALRGRGARVRTLVFEGGHEWTDAVSQATGKMISRAFAVAR